jgi:hypothetical protein
MAPCSGSIDIRLRSGKAPQDAGFWEGLFSLRWDGWRGVRLLLTLPVKDMGANQK